MLHMFNMGNLKKNMNVRDVDVELKNKFKAYCVERGKTLSGELQRIMKEELERRKKTVDKEDEKGTS